MNNGNKRFGSQQSSSLCKMKDFHKADVFSGTSPPGSLLPTRSLTDFAKMEVNNHTSPPPVRENRANPASSSFFFFSYQSCKHDSLSPHAPSFHSSVLINTENVSPGEANLVAVNSFLPCLHLIRWFFHRTQPKST